MYGLAECPEQNGCGLRTKSLETSVMISYTSVKSLCGAIALEPQNFLPVCFDLINKVHVRFYLSGPNRFTSV